MFLLLRRPECRWHSDCCPSLSLICCWPWDWLTLHSQPLCQLFSSAQPASQSVSQSGLRARSREMLQSVQSVVRLLPWNYHLPVIRANMLPASVRDTSWQACDDFLTCLNCKATRFKQQGFQSKLKVISKLNFSFREKVFFSRVIFFQPPEILTCLITGILKNQSIFVFIIVIFLILVKM